MTPDTQPHDEQPEEGLAYLKKTVAADVPVICGDSEGEGKISDEDRTDFKLLEEYDMRDMLSKAIQHALTKVPEWNIENFIVNVCNGMIGSAILHYRNKYEKKLDVKPFKEQFK